MTNRLPVPEAGSYFEENVIIFVNFRAPPEDKVEKHG